MKMLRSIFIPVFFIWLVLISCSKTDDTVHIPEYPGAIEDQEHAARMLGMSVAKVKRVFTYDSFDTVFAFYSEKLAPYEPEIVSYDMADGRQAAITIEKGKFTVAVQEFPEENTVAITFMGRDF